jgi:histidyl-tRNA synthetase
LSTDIAAISLKPPRGTHDILPNESSTWQYVEATARQVLQNAGYNEIRVPIFEHTEVFKRGVGETTDMVMKEMYTFNDKSDRSLTLRPEGTAGVVRAFLNGGMHRLSPPVKLWYFGPMFRYEHPQTGRQRQFHQVGLESFGSMSPLIDADGIITGINFLTKLGISNLEVQLNSIGCRICRPVYREKLKDYLKPFVHQLCSDCQMRFERNPLRMLDCKSETCQSFYNDCPYPTDYLCNECEGHFADLRTLLDSQNVNYLVNKRLVRGIDYYTKTALEVVSRDPRLGAQATVLAGGRYDHLVENFGGPSIPGFGWGLGVERLILLLGNESHKASKVFVVSTNLTFALTLTQALRQQGINADLDYPATGAQPRNFSKQLQQANKVGAQITVIAGDDEIASQQISIKNMGSGEQVKVPLSECASTIKTMAQKEN